MSLIPEFEQLYKSFADNDVKARYLKIEGIAPDNLDIGVQSMDFFKKI